MISNIHGSSLAQNLAILQLDKRENAQESGETDIERQSDLQHAQRLESERAAEKAREEAEKSGFWSEVGDAAKVTAAVGGVVAAGATGGSSLVVTMAVIGAAGTVATQTNAGRSALKDAGMSDDAIIAAGIASAALSMGAGGLGAATQGMSTLQAAGTLTTGGAGVVGGVAYYGEKSAQSRQTEANADGIQAKHDAERASEVIDDEIEQLKREQQNHQQQMKRIAGMQQATNDTLSMLARGGLA